MFLDNLLDFLFPGLWWLLLGILIGGVYVNYIYHRTMTQLIAEEKARLIEEMVERNRRKKNMYEDVHNT